MNIRVAQSSDTIACTVIIFRETSELDFLELNTHEKQFVEHSFKEKSNELISLNRFPQHLHLVRPNYDDLKSPQRSERLRILGNKTLAGIKGQKAEEVKVVSKNDAEDAYYFAEGLALGSYQFLKYYSDKDKRKHGLKAISLYGLSETRIQQLQSVVQGVFKARDLVNEPLSYLSAEQLAKEAVLMGNESGFSVEVFNKKKIESLKMGGILSVNRGSIDPPTFSILSYRPDGVKNTKPYVLVGKGVVYDTGGLSLKPTANSMDLMKSDMGGAAAVIGAMTAIAKSELPIHVIGLIPATDNRPGQNAYVPGDVVEMYDGSTVEVLNTDAEGRMLLGDALAYAKKLNPELVIDLATLTGAAAVAIGKFGVVAMGTAEDEIMTQLEQGGEKAYERIARFPFWDEYNDLLKSSIADVKNIGGREGGAITAGKFLERFTDYPWVHIDIAGPAFLSAPDHYRTAGGSGVGVRLLFEFLKSRADESN